MTPQEWLVKWMELKQELAGVNIYFNNEDKDEILSLGTSEALDTVLIILNNNDWNDAYRTTNPSPKKQIVRMCFNGDACPFCIFMGDRTYDEIVRCDQCGYGKRHTICDEDDSDFFWARKGAYSLANLRPIDDIVDHLDLGKKLFDSEERLD